MLSIALRNPAAPFDRSSIGKKVIVAATAAVLVAYVVGYLIGNLQIYLGADQLNSYAVLLHAAPPLLWLVRAFLFAMLGLHVVVAIQLAAENRAALAMFVAAIGMFVL